MRNPRYVGSATGEIAGPLAHPTSRPDTLADLKAGFRHRSRNEHAEAAEAFRRALEENSRMLDAWEAMARSLHKLGRHDEALEAYRRALEISGGSPHLAISAASLYFDLRRLDEAKSHARLALASNPSFAHGLLAQIALERDDLDEAERQARQALDEKYPRLGPTITLAGVLHARGAYEEALEMVATTEQTFARREAQDPELIRGLYLLKGKILADLGRATDAEAAFLREIELFPEEIFAYSNLAVGGDHAIAYPVLKAYGARYQRLNLLQLDAHPDLYDQLDGNRLSNACPFARIMEDGLAARLVQVGIRTLNPHQRRQAERFGVEIHEMKGWRPGTVLTFDGPLYLSLDLDVLDPAFAPGVSHHEPGGLSVREVITLIQSLEAPLVGADLVELNPSRDPTGVTAMGAAKLLKEIVARMLGTF